MNKGFSLIELIIVIVVIGILATFASPQFAVTKERALEREARAAIALIQAAEKIYRMEEGPYYPSPSGTVTSIPNINSFLRLDLPTNATGWVYSVNSSAQQATARRNKPGGRTYSIPFNSDTITCTGTASDPCPP